MEKSEIKVVLETSFYIHMTFHVIKFFLKSFLVIPQSFRVGIEYFVKGVR